MHIEDDLSLFNFEGMVEPLLIDIKIREKPELFVYFIRYMLGLEIGSEEYDRLKKRWIQGGYLKSGYFRALDDLQDYWIRHKKAIREYGLGSKEGVEFLIRKMIENRQQLFYLGKDMDMEITIEEIEKFKARGQKKKR
jgi:hypothetical protein